MSDHGSGPRVTANPVVDITDLYAFPSPERPGNLTLAMNVFPFAMPTAHFSDAVDYRFRMRPVRIESNGDRPFFAVGSAEGVVSVTFSSHRCAAASDHVVQTGVCATASGASVSFRVDDERGAEQSGVRVFAGPRLDSFFIDQSISGGIRNSRRLPTAIPGHNSLHGQNVLTIVVEGSVPDLFGLRTGPLFAVIAETLTIGLPAIRIERLGRPEIKNFTMLDKTADTINRDLEIRDLYNAEDAFNLMPDYIGAYRARLNCNLAGYDSLDGKCDWPLDVCGNHPLTELLLADFLVVDLSKPFQEGSYFEIERALLSGTAHKTCGGRWLNDDIVDTLLTLLVNNWNGPVITDGVDQATKPAARRFPYAQPANPNPPGAPRVTLPSPVTVP
jgi:Domain of unknown function (DUF4331)